MSHSLLVQMGGVALSTAVREHSAATQELWMTAFGVSTQYGFALPYSRLQEKEADHLGLIFMAMAGYDPHVALDFWQRMLAEKKGGASPEFFSTHPSDRQRIESIRSLIPEAMKYYHH
jgi:predicted Zn-dependent protease